MISCGIAPKCENSSMQVALPEETLRNVVTYPNISDSGTFPRIT
jgi:hypothetical protein